jgi:hypothetical protein
VILGITLYALSSTTTRFWTPVYISQGLEVNAGLIVGYNSPIIAIFALDAANGNVMTLNTQFDAKKGNLTSLNFKL